MPNYGIVTEGIIKLSSKQLEGYKEVRYAEIPDDFDQTTHYISQLYPIENDDHIFIGIETHQLEITEDEDIEGELLL